MNDSNPFQTPESDVTPVKGQNSNNGELNSNVTYQAVPFSNGATWIVDGFKNFTTSPGMWFLVVFLYFAILGSISMLPFLSIISTIIGPVFIAGLMICARDNKLNQTFLTKNLFDGFSINGGKLAGLGALNFGIIILIFIIIAIIGVVIFLGNIGGLENLESFITNPNYSQQDILFMVLLFLIALLFIIPITMAFWFAPALVVFHDVDIFKALTLSFMGCIKNVMPYLLYSIIIMVIYIIALIPIAILAAFMGNGDPNFILITIMVLIGIIELFVLSSVFFTSMYASYEDIFTTE